MDNSTLYRLSYHFNLRWIFYLSALFSFLLSSTNTFAQQSFSNTYPALTEAWAVNQTQDHGFIITGRAGDIINIVDNDIFLLKTDVDGKELWSKTYGQNDLEHAFELIETQDGGYVIAGISSSFSGGPTDVFFFKTDQQGNEIWQKKYGGLNVPDQANVVLESKDGNALYLAGCYDCPRPPLDPGRHDFYIIKTDQFGNLSWSKIFGEANTKEEAFDLIELDDGSLLIIGTIIDETGNEDILLYKIDENGNVIFTKTFGGPKVENARKIISSNDGHFLIGGTSFAFDAQEIQPDAIVLKIDGDGNEIWRNNYGGVDADIITDIIMTKNGNIAFTGVTWSYGSEDGDFYLVNLDADGNELWVSATGGLGEQSAKAFTQTNDGGYAMVGISLLGPKMQFIKTDAQGQLLSNNIQGKVFHDTSSDCLFQSSERNLSNWIVEAKGEQSFYGTTDANGNYSIPVEEGEYIVKIHQPNAYFIPCQNNYNITLTESYDTSFLDFAMQTLIECPNLAVDISTPFLSPCKESQYEINYCNNGTIGIGAARIKLDLDTQLSFVRTSSDITIEQNAQELTINLANISPGECGRFNIITQLSCDANIASTHGIQAHIFPDSICTTPNPSWDGSHLELFANCENDSVKFEIQNTGAPSTNPPQFIVVEDEIIVYIGTTKDAELELNQKNLIYTTHASGNTYRLITRQAEGHPGKSMPSVAIEGCDADNDGNYSTGFVTQYPDDDADIFVSLDNQENSNNPSPFETRGFPKGRQAEHLIQSNTDIEYHIRFQNTGVDTVKKVVIRDTLSHFMDAASLQMGTASHPYQLEVYDEGVVKITFDNIDLTGSFVNEITSYGFIKFRVAQQLDNPAGSFIPNKATAYLDDKVPVLINPIFHTIEKEKQYERIDVDLCRNKAYNGIFYENDIVLQEILNFANHDEINFSYIKILENSSAEIDTSFLRGGLYNNIAYYRDTIITYTIPATNNCDSTITVHIEVETNPVTDLSYLHSIATFPNPFTNSLSLQFELAEASKMTIQIYNLLGQKLSTIIDNDFLQQGQHNIPIPLQNLHPGTYQILLKTDKGSLVKKVVKLK